MVSAVGRAAREAARSEAAASEFSTGLAAELEGTTDAQRAGDVVSEVFDALRDDASPEAALLRVRLHSLLRKLSEREVFLLAETIEGTRSG